MRSYFGRTGVGLATVALGLLIGPAAHAAGSPMDGTTVVQAGLAITPSVTVVGNTVTVVATATNTSDTPANGALGIDNYSSLHTSSVSGVHCSPRNVVRTIYCGLTALPPGATASITVTIVPAAAGSFDFRSYAHGTQDTFAYGTLTVS
jgi:hypothetical protein